MVATLQYNENGELKLVKRKFLRLRKKSSSVAIETFPDDLNFVTTFGSYQRDWEMNANGTF